MATKENSVEMVNQTLATLDALCNEQTGVERPTLRAIAAALDVPQQRIYSVAKQPKAGEVYDANVYNWDAIDRFITRRLDPDKGLATHEDVINKAIELSKEFKAKDGRKGPRAATKADIALPDGSSMPARRTQLEVGMEVMMRQDKTPVKYTVVMLTETHAVLQPIGMPTLSCYSNWTLNQKVIVGEEAINARVQALEEAAAKAAAAAPATEAPDTSDAEPSGTVIG